MAQFHDTAWQLCFSVPCHILGQSTHWKVFWNISQCSLSRRTSWCMKAGGRASTKGLTWGPDYWSEVSSQGPGVTLLTTSHFVGRGQEHPALPGILHSCLLVLCWPSFWRGVFARPYPASSLLVERIYLIPSLSTSDLPALLWLKRVYVTLNLNGQSRTPATDHLDCRFEHKTQAKCQVSWN